MLLTISGNPLVSKAILLKVKKAFNKIFCNVQRSEIWGLLKEEKSELGVLVYLRCDAIAMSKNILTSWITNDEVMKSVKENAY